MIKAKRAIVEMDGDQMTRVIWRLVKDQLVLPFVDVKLEYYDPRLPRFEDASSSAAGCASCGACRDCGLCAGTFPCGIWRLTQNDPLG